jgi:hypothetical protein
MKKNKNSTKSGNTPSIKGPSKSKSDTKLSKKSKVHSEKSKKSVKVKPKTKPKVKPRVNVKDNFETLLKTGGTVPEHLPSIRFVGVSMAGGKTDKTSIAVLEYFPDRRRVFLRSLREKVRAEGDKSSDFILQSLLTDVAGEFDSDVPFKSIAIDAPLSLPVCLRCDLPCPGYEDCGESHIQWMWRAHSERSKSKRPNKIFTPYTERCSEIHIANHLEEPFYPSHALGANAAPLAARAIFLGRRLTTPLIEVFPKLTLWRIGMALGIPKSYLRFHRHAIDGDEARLYILKTLLEKEIAFVYQQDMRLMVEYNHAFEAFLAALTGFLEYRGQTERPPTGFPKSEKWITFPKEKIQWF